MKDSHICDWSDLPKSWCAHCLGHLHEYEELVA